MDENNLEINFKALIANLLSDGLSDHYDEVLNILEKGTYIQKSYIIFALDYLQQSTLLLNLKINSFKANALDELINIPNSSHIIDKTEEYYDALEGVPSYLQASNDGYIHLTLKTRLTSYYPLTDNMISKFTFDDVMCENVENTINQKFFFFSPVNGKYYFCFRSFIVGRDKKVIKYLGETVEEASPLQIELEEEKEFRKFIVEEKNSEKELEDDNTGYQGILKDLLDEE